MSPRVFWIGMVVGILGMSVTIQTIMIFCAVGDPSFAIDPDYQASGANHAAQQAQRADNDRLRWGVDVSTRPGAARGQVEVELRVEDRYGRPIDDAAVDVATFHNARAAKIIEATLPPVGGGVYADTLRLERSGIWEFRVTVRHGEDVFTHKVKKSVVSPL